MEEEERQKTLTAENATVYKPDGTVNLGATFANLRAIKARMEREANEKKAAVVKKEDEAVSATVYLPDGRVDLKATFANLRAIKAQMERNERLDQISIELRETKDPDRLKALNLEANRLQLEIMKGPKVKLNQTELKGL